jgi:EmrB/QacA subfamily drug resistance transporter
MKNSIDKRFILLIVALPNFLFPFMSTGLNVALPSISSDLSMDAISLGWVITAYQLASMILVLPFGKLSDLYGRKRILTIGMFVCSFACLLLMLSNSAVELISFRVLQGIGGVMSYTPGMAILISVFPAEQRGKALGLLSAAVYAGQSAGPFIGGMLTHYFGWRSIFFTSMILGLLTIALIYWKMKGEWLESKGEKFDSMGATILGFGLFALVYGLSSLPGTFGLLLIGIGLAGLLAFIFYELRATSPLLNIDLFRKNRVFAFSSLALLLNFGAIWPITLLMSLYLQYIKGFNPQDAGLILITQPLMQVALAPFAGRLSDKVEPRIITSISMALTTIGLAMFAFLNNDSSLTYIIAGLFISGVGFSFFGSPNNNALMSSVDKKYYGTAAAVISLMRQMGIILSMGMIMMLFSIYIGKVQITPEYYDIFLTIVKIGFTVCAALCFGGIFVSLSRGKKSNQTEIVET